MKNNFLLIALLITSQLIQSNTVTSCAPVTTPADRKALLDLYFAIRQNDVTKAREAIKNGADVNALDPFSGELLFITAIRYAPYRELLTETIIDLMLEKGISKEILNTHTHEGLTPLMLALFPCFSLHTFELLIAAQADVHATNKYGENILEYINRISATLADFAGGTDKTSFEAYLAEMGIREFLEKEYAKKN